MFTDLWDTTLMLDFKAIRELREAGYEVVRRDRLKTLSTQTAIDDLELEAISFADKQSMKRLIKSSMITALAHNLADNESYLRIVEHEPNPTAADPFMRLFRADITLLAPKFY